MPQNINVLGEERKGIQRGNRGMTGETQGGSRARSQGDGSLNPKQQQRQDVKQRRFILTTPAILEKSQRICRYAQSMLEDYETILVYSSKHPEVDTTDLIATLLRDRREVIMPIIERETRTLRLSYLRDISVLVKSTFNVPEPIGNEIPADPRDIEAGIIPMVAYDRWGNRLGYGAGYYDKFLTANRDLVKIGLAFACQEEERICSEPDDVRMDYVVTEEGVYICREGIKASSMPRRHTPG